MCKKQCYHRAVLYTIKEGRERKRKDRERDREIHPQTMKLKGPITNIANLIKQKLVIIKK